MAKTDEKSTKYAALIAKGDSLVDTDSGKAVSYYEKAFEMDSSHKEPLVKKINILLDCIYELDDYDDDDVIEDVETLSELFADDIEAQELCAKAYMSYNMFDEAEHSLASVIAMDQGRIEAYTERGEALGALGRYEGAARMFEQAADLDPDNVQVICYLCVALENLGEYKRALEALEAHAQRNKEYHHHVIYRHMGRMHGLLGNTAESFAHYVKSVNLPRPRPDEPPRVWERYKQIRCARRRIEDLDPTAAESFYMAGLTMLAVPWRDAGISMLGTGALLKPAQWVYVAMADSYALLDKHLTAVKYYRRALDMYTADSSNGGEDQRASIYGKMIRLLFECGQHKDAMNLGREAESLGLSHPLIEEYYDHLKESAAAGEAPENRDLVSDGWTRMRT